MISKKKLKEIEDLKEYYSKELDKVKKENKNLTDEIDSYKKYDKIINKLWEIQDNLGNINAGLWLFGVTYLIIELIKLNT